MFDKGVTLYLDGQPYYCRVAETPLEKQIGLEESTGLGPQEGMFFPFGGGMASLWMGRVAFPLTFVFLDGNRRPMKAVRDVQPGDRRVFSQAACWGAIEIAGNWR